MTIYTCPQGGIALRDLSITERVFEGVQTRADVPVLIDGPTGREMTGAAFMAAVKALAGGLTERGFGKGATVALMMPNIPEFCVAFHAVAWAGGTVTTVNPAYTAHELGHQLMASAAALLITVPELVPVAREGMENTGVRALAVVGEAEGAIPWSALVGAPLEAQVPVDLDDHILVLPFSSGTTGLPKGVMLTHRNLVANVEQLSMHRPCGSGEWTVGFLPFFHIYGLTVLANFYLASGGGVVTMPRFDLPLFLKLCQDHRVPQVFVVPPVVLAMAKHPLVGQFDLSALRYLFSGAAPLGASLAEAAAARLGAVCEQGYGMTEMSPVSHCSRKGEGRPGAAGTPVPGTECRIVDPATMTDVPRGGDGELWVRGPQVMKGYLNNPQATADTLLPGGWLRTGDIGAFDADGHLYIRDRLKELIKMKGFQVAPAELESVLIAHPDIADAAVVGEPDEEAGEVPVAYLVAASEKRLTPDEIEAWFEGKLAHFKRVRRIRYIDAIPKSPSGKILRRLLRERPAAT